MSQALLSTLASTASFLFPLLSWWHIFHQKATTPTSQHAKSQFSFKDDTFLVFIVWHISFKCRDHCKDCRLPYMEVFKLFFCKTFQILNKWKCWIIFTLKGVSAIEMPEGLNLSHSHSLVLPPLAQSRWDWQIQLKLLISLHIWRALR